MLDAMKTLTTREFFHSPGLIKSLRPGQSVVVTDQGKPSLIVTKAGRRPRRSLAELKRRAMEISPITEPKVNFTEMLRELKTK
jgi:antitoxin (DNA-binding transcriptional repressor) of toxin-antitoxin stability system